MAYYFAVQKKDKNYVGANIKKSGYFDLPSTYSESCACTLEEIDRYTTRFPNESFFKRCLVSEEILSQEDIDQPLSIIYVEDEDKEFQSWQVKGSILYFESKKYIENTQTVIDYIETKTKENDYTFFRELAQTMSQTSISASLVTRIASLLEKSVLDGEKVKELDAVNPLGENMVIATAKMLIYKNCIVPETGSVTYTNDLNYEAFHNLVSFITNYEKTLEKDKSSCHKYVKTKNNN